MKGIYFKQTGNPKDVLAFGELQMPQPCEGEVLVRVLASPINPADILFIKGNYRIQPSFPQTAGLEGAGIIEKCGEGVSLEHGALVSFRSKNVWSEYVAVPVDRLYHLPQGFPLEKAAQFSLNPVTAWALLEEAKLKENEWLLLTAGNSAVSKLVIQLAKKRNIKVVATVRSSENTEELMALGTDVIVNTEAEQLSDKIASLTDGKGVQAALDAVGGQLGNEVIKTAGQRANIILYGLLSPDLVCYHNADVILKLLTIKGFGLDNWLAGISAETRKNMIDELVAIIHDPKFRMAVADKFSLEDYQNALESSVANQSRGKTLFCL